MMVEEKVTIATLATNAIYLEIYFWNNPIPMHGASIGGFVVLYVVGKTLNQKLTYSWWMVDI
jgi:hypothetical protein